MKKKILSLLALVMAAMTASAKAIPTYSLTVGTNEHGSVTFKVGNNPVTAAAEGVTVTMTVNPNNGWSVYEPTGVWDAAIARVQAQNVTVPVSRDVELTPVIGKTNQWTFTMKRANAYFSVSYRKLIQASWIGAIQSQTYNGQEHRPAPVVRVNGTGTLLTAGTDYTVDYDDNIKAGTAKVTVTINPESELYDGSASKTFTIQKANLTVKADNKSVLFGDPAPTYTASYIGFVNGETKEVLGGTLGFSCPYVRNVSPVGSYDITPSGLTSPDYSITFTKGTLTVGKKDIEDAVIQPFGSLTYSGEPKRPAPVVTFNGMTLKEGTDYTLDYSNNVNAGTATVIAIGTGNFSGTVSAPFTIQKKTVTVSGFTAENKTYDGNDAAVLNYDNVVLDGLIEGENLTVEATGRFINKNVGSNKIVYINNIILDGADISNYKLANYVNQPTTWAAISKKTLTVTANDVTVGRGDDPANNGVSYDGFVENEDESELEGELKYAYNTAADGSGDAYEAGSPVGSYYIIPSGLSAQNYSFVYYTGVLTVEPVSVALAETDDNTQTLADKDGAVANVTLTRTLQPGNWNTFAVPFALSGDELAAWGITAKELTSSSFVDGTLSLTFDAAESIEAGKPYLVQVDATLENPTFENVRVKKDAVTVETEAVNFIPTLGKTLVTGPEGDEDNADAVLFLAAGNRLTNPSVVNTPDKQSSYMKGFRAFFQLKGDAAMSNLRAYSIDFGDGEATEIVEVDGGQLAVDSDDSWYDLQGRKLDGQPTTKGVYIWKGKKVTVK